MMARTALALAAMLCVAAALPLDKLLLDLDRRQGGGGDGADNGGGSDERRPPPGNNGGGSNNGPEEIPEQLAMGLFGLFIGLCHLNDRVNVIEEISFPETTRALIARAEMGEGLPSIDEVCKKLWEDIDNHMNAQQTVEDAEKTIEGEVDDAMAPAPAKNGKGSMEDKVGMIMFGLLLGECNLDSRVRDIESVLFAMKGRAEGEEPKTLEEVCTDVMSKLKAHEQVNVEEEMQEEMSEKRAMKALKNLA